MIEKEFDRYFTKEEFKMVTICGQEFPSIKELCETVDINPKAVYDCKRKNLLDFEEAFCYVVMKKMNVNNTQLLFAIEQSICVLRLLQQRVYPYANCDGEIINVVIMDELTRVSLTKLVFTPNDEVIKNFGNVDESIIPFLLNKHLLWARIIQKGIEIEAILEERKGEK